VNGPAHEDKADMVTAMIASREFLAHTRTSLHAPRNGKGHEWRGICPTSDIGRLAWTHLQPWDRP